MKISVSNNKEVVEEVRKKLRANDGYCPCKLVKAPDTKCMCQEFLNQDEPGECHCGLYVKAEV